MIVNEWLSRLAHPGHVSGLVISPNPPYEQLHGDAIYKLEYNEQLPGDVIVWSVPPQTWPRGQVRITIMPHEALIHALILDKLGEDWAVYDNDIVRLREWGVSQAYGFPPEVWVSATMDPGTGYFTGPVMDGDQKTHRTVTFMPTDVRAIKAGWRRPHDL